MRVELNYGKGTVPLELSDQWSVSVIRKPAMPVLADPPAALRAALAAPVASGTLMQEAGRARSACILICDITRPVPNGLILPALVRELLAAGLKRRLDPDPGRHRAAPPQRGQGAGGAGRRSLGAADRPGGKPLCAQRCGPRAPGDDRGRHGGEARPALRSGGPQDRYRAGGTAFHGRLLRRSQGHRTGDRPQRHHHDVPQRPLHVRSEGRQLRARGQPVAPRAAGDRADAAAGSWR